MSEAVSQKYPSHQTPPPDLVSSHAGCTASFLARFVLFKALSITKGVTLEAPSAICRIDVHFDQSDT
jgi:hypothetical protein